MSTPSATRFQKRLRGRIPPPPPHATQLFIPSMPSETRTRRALQYPPAPSKNKGARRLSSNIQRAVSHSLVAGPSSKGRRAGLFLTNDKETIHLLSPQVQHDRIHRTQTDPHRLLPTPRSLTHPIHTLPNELIAEIFSHICDPTLVTQICRHLRDVALSCPSLWSTISLTPNHYNLHSQLAMTKEWSTRSGGRPLSVTIDDGGPANSQAFAPPSALYAELVLPMLTHRDTLSRLERLDFWVDLSSSSLKLLQTEMPNLTHLGLSANRVRTLFGKGPVVVSPQTFPRLRSFELRSVFKIPSVEIPYAQITTLRFDDIEYCQLRDILAKTTALVHCEASNIRSGGLDDGKMLRMEHLQSLVFSHRRWDYSRWEDVVFPIAAMTLPSLRILQVPEIFLNHPSHEGVLSLVERSGCRLEELRIIGLAYTSEATFREKLACVPTISLLP
ncbi:hypothetical protein DFH06DRAFT_1323563 [Mycena polygramma]|nr:hypothetical protein DFH06DRAFT_1323563 [Mycena polygramma]